MRSSKVFGSVLRSSLKAKAMAPAAKLKETP